MQNGVKFLAGVLLVLGANLFAGDNKVTYSLSLVGMSMDYKEYDRTGTLVDSEKSGFTDIGGFEIGYDFLLSKDTQSYSKLETSVLYLSGDTVYTGSLLSGGAYGSVVSKTVNDVIDTRIAYQVYREIDSTLSYNYGLGVGYRYWRRALSASQIEEYTWFSLRPKVGLEMHVNPQFVLSTDIEYQYGLKPTMTANNVSGDFTLGSADILALGAGMAYQVNPKIDLFVNYVFQRQEIKASDTVYSGGSAYFEPDSTAYNQYIKLGIAFKY